MSTGSDDTAGTTGNWWLVVLAWALVSAPLLWGVWMTFKKAMLLFRH